VAKKLAFIITHGPEETEKVTVPFTMAVACQALGSEVVIGLQGAGAGIAAIGAADSISFPGCAPLKELMDIFRSYNGRMLTCGPPLDFRKIDRDKLIDGVEIVDAEAFAELYSSVDNVMVY
jgi:predicted peroxiredoxin